MTRGGGLGGLLGALYFCQASGSSGLQIFSAIKFQNFVRICYDCLTLIHGTTARFRCKGQLHGFCSTAGEVKVDRSAGWMV